jgi:hypothetical protein
LARRAVGRGCGVEQGAVGAEDADAAWLMVTEAATGSKFSAATTAALLASTATSTA